MVGTSICGDEEDISLHKQQILMKFIRNIKEIHGISPNSKTKHFKYRSAVLGDLK